MANEGALFDEFVEGGLIDDADVTLAVNRFVTWDYNGTVKQPVLALKSEMIDGDGKKHEQYMSCGELRFFVPSADGRKAVPVGSQQKLNKNTNAVAFIISVLNADTRGELATQLRSTGDVGLMDGLKCHVNREKQPKRAGIESPEVAAARAAGGQAQERDRERLICSRILAYPNGTPVAAPAAGTAAAGPTPVAAAAATPVAAPAMGGEADGRAVALVLSIIGEAGGSIKKSMVAGKVFPAMKDDSAPLRNAVLALVTNDGWLAAQAGNGIAYNKEAGTIAYAG